MNDYDFAHFCSIFSVWFKLHGFSQAKLAERGGPSKPVTSAILHGTWTSQRPQEITRAVDTGFGWPEGTAWRVLTVQLNISEVMKLVSTSPQDAHSYVEAPGGRVESGVSNEDLLREIVRSRRDTDQIQAEQREQRLLLESLSSRVEKLEEHGS